MATGYTDTFIVIAADCPVDAGAAPPGATTVAGLQHALLTEAPYTLTGDELILEVHLRHKGICAEVDREAVRAALFAKSHPCLRASPLPKRYGWGVHYDGAGRIALYGAETADYRRLAADPGLTVLPAMRNRSARRS